MPEPSVGRQTPRIRLIRRRRRQEGGTLVVLLLLAAAVFCGGITWGLPSRDVDQYLFGDRPAWSGKQIVRLTGERITDPAQAADVDRNPLAARENKVVLNRTDEQRAEIVRRYRLFTYQPDEMVTMMALAAMNPGQGDFDPRLYQYGGAWIYPIGVLLKAASIVSVVRLTPDVAYSLDNPQAFGRFYVIARLYVAAWGIVGAWAVFAIARRLTAGSLVAAGVACFCYVMMPVVVNLAHEAKPHLPGAVLMLLSLLAAIRYVRQADPRWWFVACVLAGLAMGMVLAAWPILVVLPAATLMLRQEWPARIKAFASGLAVAVVVYFITNPYVLIHLFNNRELLRSSLGNTRGMFQFGASGKGLMNGVRLIAEGSSPMLAAGGVISIIALAVTAGLRKRWTVKYSGWLLIAPAFLALLQFVLFASAQPAEYGRFAVFLDIVLVIAAVVGAYFLMNWLEWRPEFLALLGLSAAIPGSRYYAGFVSDSFLPTSRTMAAQLIDDRLVAGATQLAVRTEPAPYSVPPANLFEWQIVLLPKDYTPASDADPPDVVVWALDEVAPPPEEWAAIYDWGFVDPVPGSALMRWAGKPFIVLTRRSL